MFFYLSYFNLSLCPRILNFEALNDLLFFDVKSNVGNAFKHGFAHGLLDFEMVGSRKREEKVLVKRNGQVTHAATALANPATFGRGKGAFYGIVGAVAVGHISVFLNKIAHIVNVVFCLYKTITVHQTNIGKISIPIIQFLEVIIATGDSVRIWQANQRSIVLRIAADRSVPIREDIIFNIHK